MRVRIKVKDKKLSRNKTIRAWCKKVEKILTQPAIREAVIEAALMGTSVLYIDKNNKAKHITKEA